MSAKIICGVLGAAAALGGVVVYLTGAVVPGFILITGGVLVSLIPSLVVAGKDVVDVGAAVAVMGDSSAAQTALEVGGPQARPLISC